MTKVSSKRSASSVQTPAKKRRLISSASQKSNKRSKEKAADRPTIPIPSVGHQDEAELSDQDLEVLEAYSGGTAFLQNLDQKAISQSKKEIRRLHRATKPAQKPEPHIDLPSIASHDEDQSDWDSDLEGFASTLGNGESDSEEAYSDLGSDEEMPYETVPRPLRQTWGPDPVVLRRLPIKLADGRVVQTGIVESSRENKGFEGDEDFDGDDIPPGHPVEPKVEDVSTGARFGRPAVVDTIGRGSRKESIQASKEQIASICQEIVGDPENSLGLLRRLHTFSLAKILTPSLPDPVPNDPTIRKLALLSQLAVFRDIIPTYRIRQLTDKEKTETVSQMVARTREWEQGLVIVYQTYLRSLEAELKAEAKSELANIALQCICTLAVQCTHFNFSVNIMSCIVAQLSKKTWDRSSDLCLDVLIKVFRADLTGVPSLEIVRLLNRMIKGRRFNVNPEVLSSLLHLRLKSELSIRASERKADKESGLKAHSKGRAAARRAKGKPTEQPHLSKKMKKALKEKKEIEREFREAEAEVDKEQRETIHTETLKLLFVLYFSILKNPHPTPLLPAALSGISKFAHLVNVDFFKDLMNVIKGLISTGSSGDDDDIAAKDVTTVARDVRHRLQCVVTAFELLSGQGEALNIDLSDFIAKLYAIIPSLSLMPDIDNISSTHVTRENESRTSSSDTLPHMLFRALSIVFSPRSSGATSPTWRSAAFAKRLLSASLHWPPSMVLYALEFVGGLVAKDSKLEALLTTDDRTFNGVYRPDIDDPQLCNALGTSFWELQALRRHYDHRVRAEASKLLNYGHT